MDLGLQGRTAFVAAASRGLGRATAMEFSREGADVGICSRSREGLDEARRELAELGHRVVATVADVRSREQVEAALAATVDATGRLDCLVVNAGGPPPGRFDDLSDGEWSGAVELTLMSAVHLVRAALPWLRRSDAASITIISSLSVRQPIDNLLLSNSLRAAVTGLAKTLSIELAPRIRVNSVLAERIRTGRTEALAMAGSPGTDADVAVARAAVVVPLGRYAHPAEFARSVVFLASPASSFTTGIALPVDGGMLRAPA